MGGKWGGFNPSQTRGGAITLENERACSVSRVVALWHHSHPQKRAYAQFRGWWQRATTTTFGNEHVCSFLGVVALCHHHHPPSYTTSHLTHHQPTTPRSLKREMEVVKPFSLLFSTATARGGANPTPFSFRWRQHKKWPSPPSLLFSTANVQGGANALFPLLSTATAVPFSLFEDGPTAPLPSLSTAPIQGGQPLKNECLLVFDGGCLFSASTTLSPSKTSKHARLPPSSPLHKCAQFCQPFTDALVFTNPLFSTASGSRRGLIPLFFSFDGITSALWRQFEEGNLLVPSLLDS